MEGTISWQGAAEDFVREHGLLLRLLGQREEIVMDNERKIVRKAQLDLLAMLALLPSIPQTAELIEEGFTSPVLLAVANTKTSEVKVLTSAALPEKYAKLMLEKVGAVIREVDAQIQADRAAEAEIHKTGEDA